MLLRRRRLLKALPAAACAAVVPSSSGARAQRRSADPGIAFPAAGRRAWAAQVPQLRVGVLGGENEADRLGRYDAYRGLLERTFEVSARLFLASDYAGVIQAFGARQLDIATMSPAARTQYGVVCPARLMTTRPAAIATRPATHT